MEVLSKKRKASESIGDSLFEEFGDLFDDNVDINSKSSSSSSSSSSSGSPSKKAKIDPPHNRYRLQSAVSELDTEVEARCKEMHELTTTACQSLQLKLRIDLDRIPSSIRRMRMSDFVKSFKPEDILRVSGNAVKAQKELDAWVASTPSVARKQGKLGLGGTVRRSTRKAALVATENIHNSVRRSTRKRTQVKSYAQEVYQTPRYNTRRASLRSAAKAVPVPAPFHPTSNQENDTVDLNSLKKNVSKLTKQTAKKAKGGSKVQGKKAERAKQVAELARLRAQLESLASELVSSEEDSDSD